MDTGSQMIDVGEKAVTKRRAVAQGRIAINDLALAQIRARTLPKGDAIAIAEVAGIMAAKRTSDILPLCHPLPLDHVSVKCAIDDKGITATCEASTSSKTGVEMEALSGVTAALLCIYDMAKGLDPAMTISDIVLQHKEGGRSGVYERGSCQPSSLDGYRAAVVTISDRCFQGVVSDRSGPYLVDYLYGMGANIIEKALVPDDKSQIRQLLGMLVTDKHTDLIVLTGGTGLSPADVTPETLQELAGRAIPGIGELLRTRGSKHTNMSWLSRCDAYLVERTLIISLPGSLKAVAEGMNILSPLLSHALHVIRGGNHG
jgi:molybdenum cofactor biosynthesis protein MoaC